MRRALTLLLLFCVLGRSVAMAEPPRGAAVLPEPDRGSPARLWLHEAVAREAARLAFRQTELPSRLVQAVPPSERRGWIRRHPALFGALVGAGAGAVSSIPRWTELYCSTGGDEDCLFHDTQGLLFGMGAGAGLGSLIGWLAGRP